MFLYLWKPLIPESLGLLRTSFILNIYLIILILWACTGALLCMHAHMWEAVHGVKKEGSAVTEGC